MGFLAQTFPAKKIVRISKKRADLTILNFSLIMMFSQRNKHKKAELPIDFGRPVVSIRPVALRQWIAPPLLLSVSCIILMNLNLMLSASQARKALFFSHLDVLMQKETMNEVLIFRNGLSVAGLDRLREGQSVLYVLSHCFGGVELAEMRNSQIP